MENLPRPTGAELEILTVLWSRGATTVRDVHEIIASRRPTQYTTVLKQMQVMAEKGLVVRNEDQRRISMTPRVLVNGLKSSLPRISSSAPSTVPRQVFS